MAKQMPCSRRQVLRTAGTFAAAGMATGAGAATRSNSTDTDARSTTESEPAAIKRAERSLNGFYAATVDRIVDGDHVVILAEADGEVVEQFVVSRDRLPTVSEGDRLVLLVKDGELLATLTL